MYGPRLLRRRVDMQKRVIELMAVHSTLRISFLLFLTLCVFVVVQYLGDRVTSIIMKFEHSVNLTFPFSSCMR